MFYVHQKFLPGEAEGKNLIHEIQTLFYLRANAPSYKITILKNMFAKVKKNKPLLLSMSRRCYLDLAPKIDYLTKTPQPR